MTQAPRSTRRQLGQFGLALMTVASLILVSPAANAQSKKDSGGYWAMNIGGGRTWIDPVAVKNGIEYTHNAIKKPTKDAVLLLDEIGDEA